MKLIFEDYLGQETAIEVIAIKHMTDRECRPIDIVVTSFNKEELEEIGEEFGEYGYNIRQVEKGEIYGLMREYGVPKEVCNKLGDNAPVYEALYARLSKFRVENPMGGVVYN